MEVLGDAAREAGNQYLGSKWEPCECSPCMEALSLGLASRGAVSEYTPLRDVRPADLWFHLHRFSSSAIVVGFIFAFLAQKAPEEMN